METYSKTRGVTMSIKLNGHIIAKSILTGTELNELLISYATSSALSAETTRATNVETTLTNNLAAEVSRAEAAEATKLSASDTTVTKQGNAFNGASQLVQLNSSAQLPAVSGVNLTGLTASQITNASTSFANTNLSNLTLANALTNLGFTGQSITQNGYYKMPNGLIIQWGLETIANTTSTITLPISFTSTSTYMAVATMRGNSSGYVSVDTTSSASQISLYKNVAYGCNWIAIGF